MELVDKALRAVLSNFYKIKGHTTKRRVRYRHELNGERSKEFTREWTIDPAHKQMEDEFTDRLEEAENETS